jgi:hypothetical protein
MPLYAIIGGVVGGAAVLLVLVGALLCYCIRRRQSAVSDGAGAGKELVSISVRSTDETVFQSARDVDSGVCV